MTGNRRPAPPPLEANDQWVTAVITIAWAIALVVVLVLRPQLPADLLGVYVFMPVPVGIMAG